MKLRSQISLLLTTLIVLSISATAAVLIYQNKQEISNDIYLNARNFSELTASRMATLVGEYLPSESFVLFNPQMKDLLRKNSDVLGVEVYDYSGKLLYNSTTEKEEQYKGPSRENITDPVYQERIQAQNPSLKTILGEVYYLEKADTGQYHFVSKEGIPFLTQPNPQNFQIANIVYPVSNTYAVAYNVSYLNLWTRLQQAAINIGMVALAAILFSILIGLLFAGTIARPLRKLTKIVEDIAQGNLDQRAQIKSKDEVGILAKAVNQMATDLKKGIEARVYQEKTQKEIELATKIQQALLPKDIPDFEQIDVSAELVPAAGVSGDVYDLIRIDNEKGNYLYCYLGDVTGHGISAGLLSTTANAMIAMLAPEEPDPVKLLAKVNVTLKAKTSGAIFITLALVKYDFQKKKLSYVNAGHEQILKYNTADKTVDLTAPGGIALGMLPEIHDQLKEVELDLKKGDAIMLYSDGLPEAWQNEKDTYGMERLTETFSKYGELKTADAIQKATFKDVNDFRGKFEQKDDMTLIIIKKD